MEKAFPLQISMLGLQFTQQVLGIRIALSGRSVQPLPCLDQSLA